MMPSYSLRLLFAGLISALLVAGCAGPGGPAAAPAETGASRATASEAPRERAGLGTGFGETRNSATSLTSFVRANASQPAATDRLYYNDAEGLASAGPLRRAPSLAPAPGGLVSWGLRGGGVSGTYLVSGGDYWRGRPQRYVTGRKGERYQVVVRNETGRRVEAVLSVDGLDVLDGRPASTGKRGYILQPHQILRVDGFRTSEDTVAAFRFSSVSRSYAALSRGETRNVGVIGLAVFEEKRSVPSSHWAQPPPDRELERRHHAEPFPGGR